MRLFQQRKVADGKEEPEATDRETTQQKICTKCGRPSSSVLHRLRLAHCLLRSHTKSDENQDDTRQYLRYDSRTDPMNAAIMNVRCRR